MQVAPDLYRVTHNGCYRHPDCVFTFIQTQKETLKVIHVNIIIIWKDVGVSAACNFFVRYTSFSSPLNLYTIAGEVKIST